MALQVNYPLPDVLNLLLQGADGLQFPLDLRGQVTGPLTYRIGSSCGFLSAFLRR